MEAIKCWIGGVAGKEITQRSSRVRQPVLNHPRYRSDMHLIDLNCASTRVDYLPVWRI
jgi:hypothetical protein